MSSLPNELLRDVYWSFGEPVTTSPQHFIEAAREYAAELDCPDPIEDLQKQLPFSDVRLRYEHWSQSQSGEWTQANAELRVLSPGHSKLTGAELLWELHVACASTVGEYDHRFFEGLRMEAGENPNEPPIYRVVLGS